MNKIGPPIVSDTTHSQIHACFMQFAGIAPGQANVDGTSLHVIAEFCHAGTFFSELGIGLGGTIAGDDVEWGCAVQSSLQACQKIHQARVHGFDITGAVIPQDVIDALHGIGAISPVPEITDRKLLAGMGIVE
jgi:hypothetical protein